LDYHQEIALGRDLINDTGLTSPGLFKVLEPKPQHAIGL
jgi:hypothetical protein